MSTVGAGWYKEGSVDVTQGSKTVAGTGTLWGVQARKGDLFGLLENGRAVYFYEIDTITDNAHLELVNAYAETTATAQSYAIIRNFNTTMTSETNARLVSFIAEWKLALQQNLRGDEGDPGKNGNTIYSNNGTPAAGLGVDDDWCLDYGAWSMYRKEAGSWVFRGTIKGDKGNPGESGAKWFSSPNPPLANVGVAGDYALDTTTGNVYLRVSGGWMLEGSIKGTKGDKGNPGDSVKGDKGDTGPAGSRWFTVSSVPATTLGTDTDMALNTATGDWYQKSAGTWSMKGNIKGTKGDKGDPGAPGVNWRAGWDVATEYTIRDGVYYNGSSYVAAQANVGQTPPDPTTGGDANWQVVARRGLDGTGVGDMLLVDYDSNSDGKVNAADLADQATYAASAGRATVADSADAADWNNLTSRPESFPPESHGLAVHTGATLAELNAMITDADVPSDALATTSTDGLMSAADKTKLDALGSGGGSVMLTLFHTTESQSTTEETYTALYTGNFIPRLDWHGSTLAVLVRRSGTGQIRATVTDGTDTVTDEGTAFTAEGTDELSLDVSTLDDSVLWTFTVEGKGTDCNASRVKVTADPVDEFSPPLVASGAGGTTNSATYAELASSTFLPTWLDVDGNGGVVLLADVDLGTATGADVRITIGAESATVAVSADGITSVRCPFPATAAAMLTARIDGRIAAGAGTMSLNHYQIHIEK